MRCVGIRNYVRHFACGVNHTGNPAETSGRIEAQELGSLIDAAHSGNEEVDQAIIGRSVVLLEEQVGRCSHAAQNSLLFDVGEISHKSA